jgi:lipopolysaccharide transport system permease protein
MKEARVAVYSPESQLRRPLQFAKASLDDLVRGRELAWQLMIREIRQKYRQSVFGVLWALAPPIATTLVFVFLSKQRILDIGETSIPYPVYVMIGTLLWSVFTQSVTNPIQAFQGCIPIMTKVNISRAAPILSGLGQVLFFTAIQFAVAIATLVVFGIEFTWGIAAAPVAILFIAVLGAGLGMLLVPIGALYRDVGESLSIVLRLWFFLTPVVYPTPTSWPYSLLATLNPVAPLLLGARDLITTGTLEDPASYALACAGAVLVFLIGWVLFRVSVPHLVERLGN